MVAPNLRLVSPSLPGIYRSAALEDVDLAGAAAILDAYRVRTILDLRSDDELAAARPTAAARALKLAYASAAPVGPGCVASERATDLRRPSPVERPRLRLVHVPLLRDVDALFNEVESRMPMAKRAQALALRSVSGRRYDQFLCDEISRGRQTLLYTAMLRSARAELALALRTAANRSSGAVLINCAKGKDRTGVVAALLQHAAGDNEGAIVEAYAESEELLEAHPAVAAAGERRADGGGVDWSRLRGSPPEAMRETLGWLRSEYGAIDLYLEDCLGADYASWRADLLRGSAT